MSRNSASSLVCFFLPNRLSDRAPRGAMGAYTCCGGNGGWITSGLGFGGSRLGGGSRGGGGGAGRGSLSRAEAMSTTVVASGYAFSKSGPWGRLRILVPFKFAEGLSYLHCHAHPMHSGSLFCLFYAHDDTENYQWLKRRLLRNMGIIFRQISVGYHVEVLPFGGNFSGG